MNAEAFAERARNKSIEKSETQLGFELKTEKQKTSYISSIA